MQRAPLTADMQAVIDRLVRTQSVALVRIQSQWWAAENDCPVEFVFVSPEVLDATPRAQSEQLTFDKPVFRTGTIVGLVGRGRLKFAGPKSRSGYPAERPPYGRAVFRY